ncbi:hypothetical protein EMIHUDRAFT_437711 [Emiliania huxleyi CCMP1516]|uniref:SRCR domain-containing protein n=2 Tax=Emiliania huxleyi TaxID=2903 RepID=A0A0D3IIT5_EMIH1|nr:hypothetical protein EMIHUDRAFT_437711 [Emiliania huxleyi CCMP1516]EOD11170.1 hypothetical protein EMIHUDRAFT_437711 [Emiliania huxleyi CCMP1516]|eukprot:XP_005763599.1 hypothetical protein EMIHUDRAFT_437711 [Emiliania huxleyi CCMP1516]
MEVQSRSESINKRRMCVAAVLLAISGMFVVVACAVPAFSAGTRTYEVRGSDYGGSVGYGIWGVGGYLNEDACNLANVAISFLGGDKWSCSDVVSYHCEYVSSPSIQDPEFISKGFDNILCGYARSIAWEARSCDDDDDCAEGDTCGGDDKCSGGAVGNSATLKPWIAGAEAASILTVLLVFIAFVLACHGSCSRRPKPCLTAALVAAAAVLAVVPFALWESNACEALDDADLECGRSWSYALQVCGFVVLLICLPLCLVVNSRK